MKKKQVFWLLSPPLFILLFIYLVWNFWAKDFILDYASRQIPQINKMQPYADITIDQLQLSILKLQVKANGVNIKFKNETAYLGAFRIENLKLQIDPFNLLVGQFSASYLQINELGWTLSEQVYKEIFESPAKKPTEINLDPIFNILPEFPLQNIYISDSKMIAKLPKGNESLSRHGLHEVSLTIPRLQIANNKKNIELMASGLKLNLLSEKGISTDLNLNISSKIDASSIKKISADITKENSSVQINFSTKNLRTLFIKPEIDLSMSASLQLKEIRDIAYVVKNTNSRLPQASGNVKFTTSIHTTDFNKNIGDVHFSYNDINIDTFKFGSGDFFSKIKNNLFDIDKINLSHPSGLAELKNINLENISPYKFKTDINLSNFSLQKLFISLNLNNIPAYVDIKAKGKCEGQLLNFAMTCRTQFDAENISVDSDMKKTFNIVTIKKASVDADVTLNQNETLFKAHSIIKSSDFTAEGKVNYKDGFNFNCDSTQFKFDDIDNLAHLNLKGLATGHLNTYGDSSHGIIDADLDISNTGIDNFILGHTSGLLNYTSGLIHFNKIIGDIGATEYAGDIDIDLHRKTTTGHFKFPTLKVGDILSMIEDKWHLPISATGTGIANVNFTGPLDFWKLKMNTIATLNKGTLYGEFFSKLNINLKSDGEKINFDQFKMQKNTGIVELGNYIDTKNGPYLNLTIRSHGLKADDIDHLTEFYKNISGDVNINGKIIGPLAEAKILTQNQLTQFQIDHIKLPDSQLESELNKKFFQATGQIFGRQIQTDFKIPLSDTENYSIKAKIKDFNPLLLLPFISLPLPNYDIKSVLSGDINILTLKNSFEKITGKISLEQFSLERGLQTLKLEAPSEILYKNSLASMTPINMKGPDQNLSIKLKKIDNQPKIFTTGRLFLKPFQFLAPFAETISGILEFTTFISFKDKHPDFSGEGLINDASFSTKGFPYPINNASAFFDLQDSKVIFSEITGSLNQTHLLGNGLADIKGPRLVQVDVKIESEELELEYPSKIFTTGFAKINFFGDWLPYTLKIDYEVLQGLITTEFSKSDDNSATVLAPNVFLPSSQNNDNTQSLLLDANVIFKNGILVKNSMVDGSVNGSLRTTGSPRVPVFTGIVNIQPGGKLNFKDKIFEIQNGIAKFNSIKEINPDVNITANARVTDYDISLTAKGPSKKLDIKATSQPNLSEPDIFSLLALGYTTSNTDQNISSDTQQKQTGLEVLSAIGNQSDFSKKIQSRLGLNLQLAPSVDSTRNIAVPKVIVSKKLGKNLNTSYSRTLTGDHQNNEVKLQWMFRPDTSVILNYQNQPSIQENNILQNQDNEIGVGGFDIEYKKEFQ